MQSSYTQSNAAHECTYGFVDDVTFSHNGANRHTDHWRIIHRDSPGGVGGEVCYRRLMCAAH